MTFTYKVESATLAGQDRALRVWLRKGYTAGGNSGAKAQDVGTFRVSATTTLPGTDKQDDSFTLTVRSE